MTVRVRDAREADLADIVAVYNDAIPGRTATADLTPVSVESRQAWFAAHDAGLHPLWAAEDAGVLLGWLSLSEFYGRCAYRSTVEVSVYVATAAQRRGVATTLLRHALQAAPGLGIEAVLGFVFGHNHASLELFTKFGFERWGSLPRVAELAGVKRDLVIVGRHVG
jgi:L-amino acid N-acyltransferase YncA